MINMNQGIIRIAAEHLQNSFVMMVDIATFGDVDKYKKNVDEFIGSFAGLPPTKGFPRVLAPRMPLTFSGPVFRVLAK